MSVMFHGIGVSRGFAIGAAHILERDQPEINEIQIPAEALDAEIERFLTVQLKPLAMSYAQCWRRSPATLKAT